MDSTDARRNDGKKYTREQLIAVGGREWIKGRKHRIYFNTPFTTRLYGATFTTTDMQTIESATVNGKSIPVGEAKHILDTFKYGKIWYDFSDDDFHFTGDIGIIGVVMIRIKAIIDDHVVNHKKKDEQSLDK